MIEEKLTHEHRALSPIQNEVKNMLLTTMSEEQFQNQFSSSVGKLDEFSMLIGDRRIFKK
jgi:hypothetical protein